MWRSIQLATECSMNGTAEDVAGNRTFDDWNSFEDVVMAGSLVTFKGKLDHHLKNVRGFV